MKGKSSFMVGDCAFFSKTVSESDIYTYAGITGDMNPAHIDEEYAKDTVFQGRVAHGMLIAGFISTVIGMKLPGPGTIYREQSLSFHNPVRIGDTITARVEIVEIDEKGKSAKLQTTCSNHKGVVVIDGYATVFLPRRKR